MYYIGLDVLPKKYITAGVLRADGKTNALISVAHEDLNGACAAAAVSGVIDRALCSASLTRSDIKAVGVAGNICHPDKLKTAVGFDSVTFLTPADAEAIGESELGYSSDTYSLIRINIGETVDCGLLIGGKIYRGFEGGEAEIAHMTVDHGGRDCSCGKKGCFEAYVSMSGLAKTAADHNVKVDKPTDVFALGTDDAKAAAAEYTELLACGITNMINLFQPDALVLGGDIVCAGEALLKPLSEIIARDQYARHSPNKSVVKFGTNKYAAVVGAAIEASNK